MTGAVPLYPSSAMLSVGNSPFQILVLIFGVQLDVPWEKLVFKTSFFTNTKVLQAVLSSPGFFSFSRNFKQDSSILGHHQGTCLLPELRFSKLSGNT